jgi:ABC-type uncharacterized transport system substrate-binding protein
MPNWLMEIGAILTYGPPVTELFQRASTYVDKILKGAKPSDLPMQQPTHFELTISVKRARELGITVPPTVIARGEPSASASARSCAPKKCVADAHSRKGIAVVRRVTH